MREGKWGTWEVRSVGSKVGGCEFWDGWLYGCGFGAAARWLWLRAGGIVIAALLEIPFMFSKLYRHLEDIKQGLGELRRDGLADSAAAERDFAAAERDLAAAERDRVAAERDLVATERDLAATEQGERVIEQLAHIYDGLRSVQRRAVVISGVSVGLLVVLIVACVGMYVYGAGSRALVDEIARMEAGEMRSDGTVAGGLVPQWRGNAAGGSLPQAAGTAAERRIGEGRQIEEERQIAEERRIAEDRRIAREHMDRLDSLVIEQARTIRELKRLNATSVATFRRIRRHFAVMEGAGAKGVSGDVDSSVVVK